MKYFLVFVAIGVLACWFTESTAQKDYESASLREHNKYRALHKSTPAMTLDADLNRRAQQCAKWYVDNNRFDHKCPFKNGAGENLYGGGGTAVAAVTSAAKVFYDEKKDYDYNNPGFSMKTGHFTQLVWVKSTKLGVGFFQNSQKKACVVNLYVAAGNMKGAFPENVQKPK